MHPSPGTAIALLLVLSAWASSHGAPLLPIYEIQGAGHVSPYASEEVRTHGYVTQLAPDGYYLQDGAGDDNPHTSDGIFVFTGDTPEVVVGGWLEIQARVVEFTPGGVESNNLSITRLENPINLPSVIDPPAWDGRSVVIGSEGRLPPADIVDDDNFAEFDPENDGLDFFESLEGMLLTLKSPLVVCPANAKGEIYALVDGGAGSSGMSRRGTLNVAPGDYNPERIQIQEKQGPGPGPEGGAIQVGDQLEDVVGVLSYDGMFEVLASEPVGMIPGGLAAETTRLLPFPDRLRLATYHVQDLDPVVEDPALTDPTAEPEANVDDDLGNGRFDAIAEHIVHNLLSPDLIALQGVQDDDGAEITPTVRANKTMLALSSAIFRAGGPAYRFLTADPAVAAEVDDNGTPDNPDDDVVANPSGGQAGGNRRNVILYNPQRISEPHFTMPIADEDLSDGDVFAGAPHPLVAGFSFQGEEITVINVHLSDRTGGSSVFGAIQPSTELQEDPTVNGGVDRRMAQAAAVREAVELFLDGKPDANLVVLGNFNETEFVAPTLAFDGLLTNLTETLETRERYSTIAQGSSLSLDHIFVSDSLMARSPRCEVVHVNCEFADTESRASDHDPVLASLSLTDPFTFEVRRMDGYGNNLTDPHFGQAGQAYFRTVDAEFADPLNYPRGSFADANPDPLFITQSELPGARHISNLLCRRKAGVESRAGLSSWAWQWGQFLDHDFGLSGGPGPDDPRESFPIPVPPGDPDFDPFGTGAMVIPFTRSGVVPGTGQTSWRETPNEITSYIDGSSVYGSDDLRAVNLRSFRGGKLAVQPGPDGELPPFNLYGRENANDLGLPPEKLLLAGDVRANEQCALTAAHALFMREHNRLADEIAARDFPGADLDDPALDTEIYQRARKFVAALIQNITYREFLPAILGPDALPSYTGYDDTANAALSQEFANAAYRVGHTMVTANLLRFDQDGKPLPQGHLPLRHAFFNPDEVTEIGIDPYLRGLARQVQQEIDRFVIEDVRSFMFGVPGLGGLDLAAINIQRGRDHGLPSYNAVRNAYGLPVANTYHDITSDPATVAGFEAAYGPGNLASVDLWIGGISEDHHPGSQLGPTFHAVWVEQFTRLRSGDRFWFEDDPFFTPQQVDEIRNTTLADLIRRNSTAEVQDNVFFTLRRLEITFFDFKRATDTVTLTWRSLGGETFEIQASDDFARDLPFRTIAIATGTPDTTTVSFVDPEAGGKPRRAYRIIEP